MPYVLVDRGWLGLCYIRTGLGMMDTVMDWLTEIKFTFQECFTLFLQKYVQTLNFPGIFCRRGGGMRISTIGGVVSILGVVDSGLYGGGMASLYHLVTDLQALHREHRGQHTHQKEEHTDMKIHTLSNIFHLYLKRFH